MPYSGQVPSGPFKRDILYLDFSEIATEKSIDSKVRINKERREIIVGTLKKIYPDDTSSWDRLGKGEAIEDVFTDGKKKYYSQWVETPDERITVYSPKMKYSPVKVFRQNEKVDIHVWVRYDGDAEGKISGGSKTLKSIVKEAFEFWENGGKNFDAYSIIENAGGVIKTMIIDDLGYTNYVNVKVYLHEDIAAPQRYATIMLHNRLPMEAYDIFDPNAEATVAYPVDKDNKMMDRNKWRVQMHGFRIELYIGYTYSTKQKMKGNVRDEKYSESKFKILAAHEIGHLFGIGEAFKEDNCSINPSNEVPIDDIMRAGEYENITKGNLRVTPNDIEMLLAAFMRYNKLRYFYDIDGQKKAEEVKT